MRKALLVLGVLVVALLVTRMLVEDDAKRSGRAEKPARKRSSKAQVSNPPGRSSSMEPARESETWTLTVEVRTPDGVPRSPALVRFLDLSGEEMTRADTDRNGEARLEVRGTGRVAATRVHPFYPAVSQRFERPANGKRRVVMRVDAGELAIAGRVVDSDGTQPVDAIVAAKLASPRPWVGDWRWAGRTVEVAEQGRFRIAGLREGSYRLIVRVRGAPSIHGRPPKDPVIVGAGDENVRIRLESVAWLTFRWIDAGTGMAITSRREVIELSDAEAHRYSAEGPPSDELPIRGHFPRGAKLNLQATAEGYLRADLVVELEPQERNRVVEFRLEPDPGSLVELELILRDSRSDPVRDITIMRMFSGDSGSGTRHRREDGRVVLRMSAGKNRLRFGPLIPATRTLDRPWMVRELNLELERGRRRVERVVIQRGGWLRRPTWEGKPLVQTAISRAGRTVDEPFIRVSRDDYRACLAPGRYLVEARLDNALRLRGEIEIVADRTHDVALAIVK